MGSRQFTVYILASAIRRLYVGVTSDLVKRMWEHKTGSIQRRLRVTGAVRVAGLSAWRPGQLSSAQYVQMQMIHALPRILAGIRHNPITIAVEPLLTRDLRRKGEQPAEKPLFLGSLGLADRSHVLDWDDQHMHRRLGIDVP